MLHHHLETMHPLALSFRDLSVWCYPCEAYIDNAQLFVYKSMAHRHKFGEELVWSYGDDLKPKQGSMGDYGGESLPENQTGTRSKQLKSGEQPTLTLPAVGGEGCYSHPELNQECKSPKYSTSNVQRTCNVADQEQQLESDWPLVLVLLESLQHHICMLFPPLRPLFQYIQDYVWPIMQTLLQQLLNYFITN